MRCLKCGRETSGDGVFCEGCLELMAQYPVKPSAPLHLPRPRQEDTQKKTPRKRALPPEEQIADLKLSLKRLVILLIALAVAFGMAVGLLIYKVLQDQNQDTPSTPAHARNYTIDTTRSP